MRRVFAAFAVLCSWLMINACGSDDSGGGDAPPACGDCPSGLCLEDGTCVECLQEDDTCPAGSYCAADNSCAPGCKDDASCASGTCLASHDCAQCVSDAECAEGRVCANGTCSERCTAEGEGCGEDKTCCSERCTDTRRDIEHCGACGASCAASEFCGASGCAPATLANVCNSHWVTIVEDGFAADVAAGEVLRAAFESGCSPAPTTRAVDQAELSNALTGQPVVGAGELLVLSGGPFGQRIAAYLEERRTAPLYHGFEKDTFYIYRSSDDSVVASLPASEQTPEHQLVLFEVMRDDTTGTLVFMVSGFHEVGTAAGAWYFANVLLPSIADFDGRWYVYEWTDAGEPGPDSGDEFSLLAQEE